MDSYIAEIKLVKAYNNMDVENNSITTLKQSRHAVQSRLQLNNI